MTITENTAATRAPLAGRFDPILARVAAGAAERDAERRVPHDLVRELAHAGFGALRVPREFGGDEIGVGELAGLVVDLASADPNFVQLLRAHFLYTESLIHAPASRSRSEWLRRIGNGELFGGAYTERTAANQTHFSTSIEVDDRGRRLVNGEKYYSTGSLYADWIITTGEGPAGIETVVLPAAADGLDLVDDWDGFGQRLTASGTTRFRDVDITDSPSLPAEVVPGSYGTSLAQFWHIAALTGIARALHRDVVDYVRGRKRYFSQGSGALPREDAVVQSVVGEISSARYVADTIARQIAGVLADLDAAIVAGTVTDEQYDAVEIEVYRAQVSVVDTVLTAATRVFDVGGASALGRTHGWDRHWRNARTLASHNPTPNRLVSIGDHDLNGTSPYRTWLSGIDLRGRG
ncbi:acyl-CoA dehydrogenase family protein [Gordonia McavH-238-E]|uniref:acyl-CoA dehydrogenase family protein n=1 Tax=Gordonia sp. McavH-238-E TaxID=2917736 RepID=UPI001EF3F354|nr:acyl-CoA dehydrogenase family protein [Gordonia sp. McavH-238-E]MCG7634314.1 acyl-CoA dehydrogenase family protein [Gordonia sp. McavH-238-E]